MSKLLLVALILGLVTYTLAGHTLCELRRGQVNRCVASSSGTTCPECPTGRIAVGCSATGNGFPGVPQCATCKRQKAGVPHFPEQYCELPADICGEFGLPQATYETVQQPIRVCNVPESLNIGIGTFP